MADLIITVERLTAHEGFMRSLIGAVALFGMLAAGLGSPGSLSAQEKPLTVFVVRHAEKGPGTPNPSLTRAGRTRARALAAVLKDAGIAAVFSSEFKRTQETGAPLAKALGIAAERLPAGKPDSLIGRLRALPAGSRALVVTHSNLVPVIVQKLGGGSVGELTDSDYDRLYVVTVKSDGSADVLYLHYGSRSAPPGRAMRP
ncbi:MAG: phosphoglycerate mutase family protein [Gemmatimonadota bacterium]